MCQFLFRSSDINKKILDNCRLCPSYYSIFLFSSADE